MPLIITATDFSEAGNNAVNYACQLALAQNAVVLVTHSYFIPVMLSDIPIPSPVISDTLHDAEHQMDKLVNHLKSTYPGLTVKGKVLYGDIVSALDEFTTENLHPWLVVLGNDNAEGQSSWIETTLKDSFRKLKYPVLAVPAGSHYSPVKKICFAFDNKHSGNDVALKQLLDISLAINADLQVLNVQADVHNQDNNPDIDDEVKRLLSKATPVYHILFEQENTEAAIKNFVAENEIDWLILIPRKHTFFEGLFHNSLTNALARHIHIPVVALHDHHV